MKKVKELPTGKELLWSAAREIRSLRRQRNIAMIALLAIVLLCFAGAVSAAAQNASASGGQEKSAATPAPQAEKKELKPVELDGEAREILDDRQMLLNEIARVENLQGDAVKIPISIAELRRRSEAKLQRLYVWMEARGIPREFVKAGWTYDGARFIPPPAAPPAPEKKP